MAITQIDWAWFHIGPGTLNSIEINFPPDWVGAQVTLHGIGSGGAAITGIRQYRKRLNSGADEVHDFGATQPLSWPPAVFDFMSSISIGTFAASNQHAFVSVRLDHWQ